MTHITLLLAISTANHFEVADTIVRCHSIHMRLVCYDYKYQFVNFIIYRECIIIYISLYNACSIFLENVTEIQCVNGEFIIV